MTILLVLGLFAGLYIFWLAITLAVHALPLYVGLAAGFWLHNHGQDFIVSILGGFLAGVLTLSAGRLLFDLTQSPTVRLVIALLFVLPAGFAGYQAIHGIVGLALGTGMALTVMSVVGGVHHRLHGMVAARLGTNISGRVSPRRRSRRQGRRCRLDRSHTS